MNVRSHDDISADVFVDEAGALADVVPVFVRAGASQRRGTLVLVAVQQQKSVCFPPQKEPFSLTHRPRKSIAMLFRAACSKRALNQLKGASRRRALVATAGRALSSSNNMPLDYPTIPKSDHGKYKEYSVIHTDRSLNLMSEPFGRVMRDLNDLLKLAYNADKVAIIPGYVLFVLTFGTIKSLSLTHTHTHF